MNKEELMEHIKTPSEEVKIAAQLAAVKQDEGTIQGIINPSETVQLDAIEFIKNTSCNEIIKLYKKLTGTPKRIRWWSCYNNDTIGCKTHTKEDWIKMLPQYRLEYNITNEELSEIIDYLKLED